MQFETPQGPVAVNLSDLKQVQDKISEKIKENQSFALATINLDHLVQLQSNATFYKAYRDQDFVVADGNPIVWLSRIAGQNVELLPGSDMIGPLCAKMVELNVPIALVGAAEESLKKAREHLCIRYPDLQIALQLSPPYGFDPESAEAEEVLKKVHASGARLCFLAFGAPKQEVLAARGKKIAPKTGFVSIGAGLDFLAGSQHRAPIWVRKIAMEWLWRLVGNPRRLAGRYARCFGILPKYLSQSIKKRLSRTLTAKDFQMKPDQRRY